MEDIPRPDHHPQFFFETKMCPPHPIPFSRRGPHCCPSQPPSWTCPPAARLSSSPAKTSFSRPCGRPAYPLWTWVRPASQLSAVTTCAITASSICGQQATHSRTLLEWIEKSVGTCTFSKFSPPQMLSLFSSPLRILLSSGKPPGAGELLLP